MKAINKKKYLYLLIMNFMISCDPIDHKLKIINNTNDKIYYTYNQNNDLLAMYDVELEKMKVPQSYHNYINSIEANDTIMPPEMGYDAWVKLIQNSKNKKLYIFTFDVDTLEKYQWKEIVQKNKYKKRYAISLEELNMVNWTVGID